MPISDCTEKLSLTTMQSRLLAFFVSVAVFLSISTNLRLSGLPVGVGEIALLLLMIFAAFLKPWREIKSPFFLFWVAVWSCTGLGFTFGSVVGNLREHNTLAYVYTGFLTLAFLTLFSRLNALDLRRILHYFIVVSVGLLWLGLFAYANLDQTTLELLRIDTINARYQGWCQNANQMSLLLVPAPFLVIYLWSTSNKGVLINAGWGILLLLTVVVGLIVRSDALGFSWILGIFALCVFVIKNKGWIKTRYLLTMLLIFIVGFYGVRITSQQGWLGQPPTVSLYAKNTGLEKLRVGLGETDKKVGIRLQLWKNALLVWRESPIVGHGPGAYSNFDMTENMSFSGMEAHNTLIDLMVQGGLLLAVAYVTFFCWLMATVWRAGQWALLLGVVMVFAFEFFMFHLRQPVIWLYLTLIFSLARIERKSFE